MTSATAPLHIFKPGRHTAMSGAALSFSEADLQATVAAYNPAKHEAPLVVGHPQHDLPAYGWVQGLRFSDGDDGSEVGLYALPAQVNPDFADMVAAGAFKKISASFYSPQHPSNPAPGAYYLRHVGFLGAQPPAVKGLRNPSFADTDSDAEIVTLEFGEDMAPPPSAAADATTTATTQEPTVTEEEAARLRAENEAQAAQIAQLQANADRERADRVNGANTAFADSLVADGRLLPASKDAVVATLNHLGLQAQVVEFGEAGADGKKPSLLDSLKAALQAAPKAVEFGESATRDRAATGEQGNTDDAQFAEGSDPERLKQHQAIKAHMAEHKVDYATAARAVIN